MLEDRKNILQYAVEALASRPLFAESLEAGDIDFVSGKVMEKKGDCRHGHDIPYRRPWQGCGRFHNKEHRYVISGMCKGRPFRNNITRL